MWPNIGFFSWKYMRLCFAQANITPAKKFLIFFKKHIMEIILNFETPKYVNT